MAESWLSQIAFTSDNISLFYLSPYVDVVRNEDMLCMKRHESRSMFVLDITPENETAINRLLQMLHKGVIETELKAVLSELFKEDAENWYQNFIWEGLIE